MKQPTTAEVIKLGRFTACWADNTLEELQILIAEEAAPELIDRTLAALERLAKTMLTLAPNLQRAANGARAASWCRFKRVMRHAKNTIKFGRKAEHRNLLLANQVCSLIE